MDFNSIPFPLFSVFSFLLAIVVAIVIAVINKKSNLLPDYKNAIPVNEILITLQKICPINSTTKWKLIPTDHGSSRCWIQNAFLPVIKNEINLYGSAILLSSSSTSICSLIADVAKWCEWNPFYSSQYVVKSFHDKQLRRDHYMEAEQVVSIIREPNKIQPHTFMYRFHDFSESKVGWILFWDSKKCKFMFFLIQPIKNKSDNPMCLLTHIIGTESKHCSSLASLVSQRLRNIQDYLTTSSLSLVPSKLILNPQSVYQEQASQIKSQVSSSSSQENYFSLSSIRARKREVRNTVFILVPFVSSAHVFWKQNIEFKLAVKNMDSAGLEKSHIHEHIKEHVSNSKLDSHVKRPIRRVVSDVGIKSKDFNDLSKNSDSSDFGKCTFVSYIKSESKDKISKVTKQNSDTTSEDSETKNKTIALNKINYRLKLRSLSETSIYNKGDSEVAFDLKRNQDKNSSKLEDINENVEDKLVAIYEQEDCKEMYNSSISDFEIVENCEFTENRIAGFMTQGNYGASELQAEVLLASHLEDDANSGNFQFAGGWVFHSYYKGMSVLSKITCSQFMKICSFLCQTELSVPPQDVWRFVKNPQFRFICDECVKSVEVLEKISSSQKLIHTYHEVSGFLRKELIDFCLLQTEREELNKYYSCFYSIEFDKCPFMNSVTRGTLRPSGWIVEKLDENANKSKVTYMMQALINSPDSMFIQELGNMVPQSVHNLKNYIMSKPM